MRAISPACRECSQRMWPGKAVLFERPCVCDHGESLGSHHTSFRNGGQQMGPTCQGTGRPRWRRERSESLLVRAQAGTPDEWEEQRTKKVRPAQVRVTPHATVAVRQTCH